MCQRENILSAENNGKHFGGRGSARTPIGELTALVGRGLTCLLPNNPITLSASIFGPLGVIRRPPPTVFISPQFLWVWKTLHWGTYNYAITQKFTSIPWGGELPTHCHIVVFGHLLGLQSAPICRSDHLPMPMGTSVIKEIRLNNLTLTSCLSRSLKVIGTDTDRSVIYDFLLTFQSNPGPIRTVTEINGNFSRKS